uniref:Uncharacterized protein n=1 Tax=Kalanchoe fedtschenkoi TaxID=63787 RepID=A0A7N0U012_KALFE
MGNCLKKESTSEWGGEEWGLLNSKPRKPAPAEPSTETESRRRGRSENKCKKVSFDTHVEVFGGEYEEEAELKVGEEKESKAGVEQVRIRITKKHLEELLGKVEIQSLSVNEIMSCLIKEHLTELQQDGQAHEPWRSISTTAPEL